MFHDNWSICRADRASFNNPVNSGDLEMQANDMNQNPRLITVKTTELDTVKFRELMGHGVFVRKFIVNEENTGVFADAGVSIGDQLCSVDGIDVSKMSMQEVTKVLDCEEEVTARNSFVAKVRMHVNGTYEPPDNSTTSSYSSSTTDSKSILSAGHERSTTASCCKERSKSEVEYIHTRVWVFMHYRENEDLRCYELQKMSDVMLCAYIPFFVSWGCIVLGLIQVSTVVIIAAYSQVDKGVGESRLTFETGLANAYASIAIMATMYPTMIEYNIKGRNMQLFNSMSMDAERKKQDLKGTVLKYCNDVKYGRASPKFLILVVDALNHLIGALALVFTMAYQGGAVDIVLNCTAILAVVCLDQTILPLVHAPVLFSNLLVEEYKRCVGEIEDVEGPDGWLIMVVVVSYIVLCAVSYLGL